MAINQSLLESETQATVDSLTTSSLAEEILLVGWELANAKLVLTSVNFLPDLTTNPNIPDGYIVYCEDISAPVMAVGSRWRLMNGIDVLPVTQGTLWAWGNNTLGQLGDGTTIHRSSPVTTTGGGTNWVEVDGDFFKSIAIKTDGTLWTWGSNDYGQLGDGTTTNRSSPVTTAGGGTNWQNVADLSGFSLHAAAIKTDGTLWTWGGNDQGALGDGTTINRSSPVTTAGGGTNWRQVSVGGFSSIYYTAAIKTDGTLWTWGHATNLGTGDTNNRSSPVTTAAGGTNWKQVSAGGYTLTHAIKTDGTLWSWGLIAGIGTPTNVLTGNDWEYVSNSLLLSASFIKTDGTLWTWGSNDYGQLGDGTTIQRDSPVTTAGGGTNWSKVKHAYFNVSALKTDGTLWTWGENSKGNLGDGTTINRSSPVTTAGGGNNWVEIGHNFGIRAE